jgi:hypothetical protein
MQQVSQTHRPLPILDVQQSTLYLPRFVRKFPAMFYQKNGPGTNGISVIRSELYTGTVGSIPEKRIGCRGEDYDHQRRLVATIFRMAEADGGLKGKAEIHLNFGPVWEATPLPSGSYEFVTRTEHGVQVMRWVLRGEKNRYPSAAPGTQLRHKAKRFTFSIIDPNTRRHPVLASMTKSQLKVYTGYSAVATPSPGPITPSLSMSVISDQSDNDEMVDTKHAVALDDGLRTLIIITGIWVACWEGWSQNFS